MGATTAESAREHGRGPRHAVRALLRAHLAAASGYRHLTRRCAVCARLLRLATEPVTAPRSVRPGESPAGPPTAPAGHRRAPAGASGARDVSPPTT
ncbi:DUF6274 family protein [Streptomyces sp. AC1-42W]|uniref:DUF6274 family protein n=1 Tax=Streptomyces sp. AC1-42W TaxID=2218666 RepID=UPI000DAE789A|nr:DUF6274 family protein [Streptomyces sp. AC1-42W]PZT75536.1 hypothetical protein DNK56_18870 [Streptomyces sp. AC1-42W]